MSKKLDTLNENQIRQIIVYRKSHSLQETADYIKQKFGIDVSRITVKRFLEVNWKELSHAELVLLNRIFDSALQIIDGYESLLAAMDKNYKGKLMVLDKYSKFISDLFGKIDKQNKTIKTTTELSEKKELDWQKEINGKV